jgi:hypothetical protein
MISYPYSKSKVYLHESYFLVCKISVVSSDAAERRVAWIPNIKKGSSHPRSLSKVKNGANDGARTRYLHLGKVALYQMSYIRISALDFLQPTDYIIGEPR